MGSVGKEKEVQYDGQGQFQTENFENKPIDEYWWKQEEQQLEKNSPWLVKGQGNRKVLSRICQKSVEK